MAHLWHGSLHIGLVHFMAFPHAARDPKAAIETLRIIANDEFFQAVELTHIPDEQIRKRVRELLEDAHMEIGYAAQPLILWNNLNPNSLDDVERSKAIEALKSAVDEAYEIGAAIMAMLSGPYPGEENKGEALDKLTNTIVTVCQYAQEKAPSNGKPLTITLETFDRDVDRKRLIGPSQDAAELADRVREQVDNFGICIDLSHLPLLNETPEDCMATLGEHLIHVHVGNCVKQVGHPLYGDQHPPFGIAGGENDVEELRVFIEALIYSGYLRRSVPTKLPLLTFEIKPLEGQDWETVLAATKRVFYEAWSKASGTA
ncbi:MAG: TIM barrel protein [Armatimonadota bacterium]|nr:sugar phosphate isomerase/epimerase [Armatimonadota bacterium]MCX7777485.1 sugar phosphate isomerase/epimerase [Armatimonadota bacterium]MDW8025506.1 TIM barrel protein [Armatimonadota bacterium]